MLNHTPPNRQKNKVLQTFGDTVIITELNGKANVVTFRKMAESILYDFYEQPKHAEFIDEKLCIIETAAKLIKSDIRAQEYSTDFYPVPDQPQSADEGISFLPVSLQFLLRELFVNKILT